jgi:hypothetical protein
LTAKEEVACPSVQSKSRKPICFISSVQYVWGQGGIYHLVSGGQIEQQRDRRTDGWTDERWTDSSQTDGWTGGRAGGWKDRQTEETLNLIINHSAMSQLQQQWIKSSEFLLTLTKVK